MTTWRTRACSCSWMKLPQLVGGHSMLAKTARTPTVGTKTPWHSTPPDKIQCQGSIRQPQAISNSWKRGRYWHTHSSLQGIRKYRCTRRSTTNCIGMCWMTHLASMITLSREGLTQWWAHQKSHKDSPQCTQNLSKPSIPWSCDQAWEMQTKYIH